MVDGEVLSAARGLSPDSALSVDGILRTRIDYLVAASSVGGHLRTSIFRHAKVEKGGIVGRRTLAYFNSDYANLNSKYATKGKNFCRGGNTIGSHKFTVASV
jgi:hypothetical protein